MHGLGMWIYSTAASSLTADSAPPSRRGEALGYFMLATSMAMAIAPALGVYVTDHLSYVALFALSAALSLGALLCALPVKQPGRAGGPRVGDADGSDAASGHAIRQSLSSRLKCLVGLEAMFPSVEIFLGSATWGSIASFLALFAESRGIHNSGVFFSAFAVAMFATRLFAGGSRTAWAEPTSSSPASSLSASACCCLLRPSPFGRLSYRRSSMEWDSPRCSL